MCLNSYFNVIFLSVKQIEASENLPSTYSTTANVNISLSDENDNSPVFGSTKYEGKIPLDQTVGMAVVKVTPHCLHYLIMFLISGLFITLLSLLYWNTRVCL